MNAVARFLVSVCVALCAALLAHVAIDVAGDYLLARDTYDAIDHSSRGIVALGVLAIVLVAIVAALRAALADARGSERAFCATLRGALPSSPLRFAASVIALTFASLLAMEALDGMLAGRVIDDVTDLLGGSLILGPSLAFVCGALAAVVAWRTVRRCARSYAALARVVAAFLRRALCATPACVPVVRAQNPRFASRFVPISRHLAGRAPPILSRSRL